MTDIRDATISCECKKIAYRQTKDGVVVSLLVHPNDVPDALATAPLGTRYMAALVEIGDDEQPVKAKSESGGPHPSPREADSADIGKRSSASRPKRQFVDMTPAQQAGLLCADEAFQRFLLERCHITALSEDEAADAVRYYCRVKSRKDILSGTTAGDFWLGLVAHFRDWQRAPEFVG